MLPGMELMGCQDLAVPQEVMHHVVGVESGFNPYAIGVVGGRLVRQPRNPAEALATARDLEAKGYNFSLGLAQVNRHNLKRYGLSSYEKAFDACPNLRAGARILAECHGRSGGDWGKAFSCYYSGNFVTGFRHGYVQKVFASMQRQTSPGTGHSPAVAIAMAGGGAVAIARTPRQFPMASPPAGPVPATSSVPVTAEPSVPALPPHAQQEPSRAAPRISASTLGASATIAATGPPADGAFVF